MKRKNTALCYLHYMFNEWREDTARQIFKNAPCGWEYLWEKWDECRNTYGTFGAVAVYLTMLDSSLQEMLVGAAEKFYNGKK